MPKGYPNPKPAEIEATASLPPANNTAGMADYQLPPVEAYDPYAPRSAPLPPKLARVKLERNYVPAEGFKVIGHTKPEIKRKDSAGREVIIQEEEFFPGEPMPAKIAGTGFPGKLWAGTVIELPEAEAKNIVKQKIGVLEFAD